MKSQGRSVLQRNAKQDLILISSKIFWYSCDLDVFCDKGMAIPQIKFGFFLASFLHCLAFYWNFDLATLEVSIRTNRVPHLCTVLKRLLLQINPAKLSGYFHSCLRVEKSVGKLLVVTVHSGKYKAGTIDFLVKRLFSETDMWCHGFQAVIFKSYVLLISINIVYITMKAHNNQVFGKSSQFH